jgi:hypothetical protein
MPESDRLHADNHADLEEAMQLRPRFLLPRPNSEIARAGGAT